MVACSCCHRTAWVSSVGYCTYLTDFEDSSYCLPNFHTIHCYVFAICSHCMILSQKFPFFIEDFYLMAYLPKASSACQVDSQICARSLPFASVGCLEGPWETSIALGLFKGVRHQIHGELEHRRSWYNRNGGSIYYS